MYTALPFVVKHIAMAIQSVEYLSELDVTLFNGCQSSLHGNATCFIYVQDLSSTCYYAKLLVGY